MKIKINFKKNILKIKSLKIVIKIVIKIVKKIFKKNYKKVKKLDKKLVIIIYLKNNL